MKKETSKLRNGSRIIGSTSHLKVAVFLIVVVLCTALLIGLFVLVLVILQFWSQNIAQLFGYKLEISDEIGKAIMAVGGAVAAAFLALYGVQRQNESAAERHRIDSSLALRKDIFLEVAEAYAVQYRYLLSFSDPSVKEEDRVRIVRENGNAFFKLQMVASAKTIEAMLDANEEWFRTTMNVKFLGPIPEGQVDRLVRLKKIQELTVPFMRKMWRFNVTAREEIECQLEDHDAYCVMVEEKYGHIASALDDLIAKLG